LFHAAARRRFLAEAYRIHLAHDLEPQVLVERQFGLIQEPVGPRAAWLS
jgi:hypothetical protein